MSVKRFSRNALRAVDPEDQAAPPPADNREGQIRALTVVDEDTLDAMRQVFAGTDFMDDQEKVGLLLRARAEVSDAWQRTRDAFLQIGRALVDIERRMTIAEQELFGRGFKQLFPFSYSVASQFRTIARAVDEGKLPLDALPGSYSVAYQMALLSPEQRNLAEQQNLIRADVSRAALIEFRRVTEGIRPAPTPGMDPAKVKVELGRLRRAEEKMEKALTDVRNRIREMEELVEMGEGED
jgi:hypothetical protein